MSFAHDLLKALHDFDKLDALEQTEALLYIHTKTTESSSGTGTDLEALRTRLGLAKGRSAQHLANHTKRGGDGSFAKRARGYALTSTKAKFWRERVEGRAQAVETARTLRTQEIR